MLKITATIYLPDTDLQFSFIRARGKGGQNVNKVATAVQLRFNVLQTQALSDDVRQRLLLLAENKITAAGDLIIRADRHRTQERNKQDAIARLRDLLIRAAIAPKHRKKTKPTRASIEKRLTKKKLHGKRKSLRRQKLNHDY